MDAPTHRSLSRRAFLKLGAILGVASSFAGLIAGCSSNSTNRSAFGVTLPNLTAGKALPAKRKIRDLELVVTTADYDPIRYEFGLMVADNWKKLGFGVKVTSMEWSRIVQSCLIDHDYDTFTLNWAGQAERIDPDFFCYMVLHSSQTGKGQQNQNGYQSSEYDRYAGLQRGSMDQEARKQAVFKCQEIFAQDQPHTPIATRNQLMPYNDQNWEGWSPMMGEGLNSLWNFVNIKPKTSRKTLKWGYPGDVTTLNPMAAEANHDFQTMRLIYDRLVQIDSKGAPQKWAADDIKTIDDTHIEVTIRSGMKFHDGRPVTVDDVKFSFEYPARVKSGYYMGIVEPIKQVDVVNDRTVSFELKRPYASFLTDCLDRVFILPKHIWEGIPEKAGLIMVQDYPNTQPIGSGMFKIDYWRRNEEMGLSRNDDHFMKPAIDAIVKVPYASVQEMITGVQTGNVDFGGWWIEPRQMRQLQQSAPHVKVAEVRDHGYYHINYNMRRKPFDDMAIRKALAHAIPKQLIIDQLLEGHGEITHSMIAPANEFWHNPNVEEIGFNMDKSRQILKDAGYEWDTDGRVYFPPGKTNS